MGHASDALQRLIAESHFLIPDEFPAFVYLHSEHLGARDATVYMVDLDQRWLVPLPPDLEGGPVPLAVDQTLAGRAYRSVEVVESVDGHDHHVWVPMVDGTERLGVVHYVFGPDVADRAELRAFTNLVSELLVSKRAYGDFFELARRRSELTVAAELLWQLLPPLTFGSGDLAITALFVPTHDLGGDAFDYGVNLRQAQVAIFDAMGHGLDAGLMATTAVATYRNCRRSRRDLPETARAIGETVAAHFGDERFVTGLLTTLDLATGRLRFTGAGHPPPLILRHGKVVKHLEGGGGMPFGVGDGSDVRLEQLEPGDRVLLYSDGVTEARDVRGHDFGVERLADLIGRIAGADPPPETLRRLMHAVEEHSDGPLRDDATVVMVEWRGEGGPALAV